MPAWLNLTPRDVPSPTRSVWGARTCTQCNLQQIRQSLTLVSLLRSPRAQGKQAQVVCGRGKLLLQSQIWNEPGVCNAVSACCGPLCCSRSPGEKNNLEHCWFSSLLMSWERSVCALHLIEVDLYLPAYFSSFKTPQ